MAVITPTQGAETQGPNASLPFGEASQSKALQRQAGMFAHGGQTQVGAPPPMPQPGGPQQSQQSQQPQQGQQAAGPQGQPAPVQPDPASLMQGDQLDMSKVFSKPQWNNQAQSWREEWAALANHPNAGPWIKQMAAMANRQHG